MHPVATKLNAIAAELNDTFAERRDAVEAMLLAILAREHAFLLGPPGTAKSAMVRNLLHRFTGASYFEQLLSKTRPDQAVLGPYNLPMLRDEGKFQRQIDGFLLTSQFAFLDEVGKMSPTMGHDLLAALNERVRHEVSAGNSVHPIPLHSAMTASNELIIGDSEDAAALWDRLLVRCQVDYITDDGAFASLMAGSNSTSGRTAKGPTTLEYAALDDACDSVQDVKVTAEVVAAVVRLRAALRHEASITVSDRRWRASMKVLQAKAFLAGRDMVDVDDLEVLRFTLWETPEQARTVERLAGKVANPMNEDLAVITEQLSTIRTELSARLGKSVSELAGYGSESLAKLQQAERKLKDLARKYPDAKPERFTRVTTDIKETRRVVLKQALDADMDA